MKPPGKPLVGLLRYYSQEILDVIDVARLIHARFEEGSLQADSAEDHGPDDPEPIQFQLKRALANLDEAN